MRRNGLVVVISGPSGGGKSTICRRLCALAGHRYSVSATTRAPRPGERDGVEYFFVSRAQFARMRDQGELLEHSEHFGNLYGTPRRPVEEAVARGEVIVLEIDINGADQVAGAMPQARRVFVMAPDRAELERRLRGRGTEDENAIQNRLARADLEMARADSFDLQVVNDDPERATRQVADWIQAEVKRANG